MARRQPNGRYANSYREAAWSALRRGAPYAVHLSDAAGSYHLLAFDFDAGKGDPASDAQTVTQELAAAGMGWWLARSGPGGGLHVLVPLGCGVPGDAVRRLATAVRAVARSLDVTPLFNARTGCLRPPGSPHREGGRSTLLADAGLNVQQLRRRNDRAAFDRLCARFGISPDATSPAGPAMPVPVRAWPRRSLPAWAVDLLRDGDVEGRYRGDRSACALVIAKQFLTSGMSLQEFVTAAAVPANAGLAHLQTARHGSVLRARSPREAQRRARRLWDDAVRHAEAHPPAADGDRPEQVAQLVAAVHAASQRCPKRWSGQGGVADRAVLDAVLAAVVRRGHVAVTAGVREVAEVSGRSRAAVQRALRRLCADGWLRQVTPAAGTKAAVYTPGPGKAGEDNGTDESLGLAPTRADPTAGALVYLGQAVDVLSSDVASPQGLGGVAARVLVAMAVLTAATVDRLVAVTGLGARTVRKHLGRLAAAGLVEVRHDVWVRCSATLARAAAWLGVAGAARRRAEEHQLERRLYAWYGADFAARRGWAIERERWRPGRDPLLAADGTVTTRRPFPRRRRLACWSDADRLARDGWA